jgi:cell division protein FtsI/penicillin-binding protein 2
MVNYPDYDPNSFTDVYEMEKVMYSDYSDPSWDLFGLPLYVIDTASGTISSNIDGKRVKLREATDAEIGNFAIQKYKFKNSFGVGNYKNDVVSALYEPGSVFKPITMAIGIDTNEITPTDTYYDKNYVELDM